MNIKPKYKQVRLGGVNFAILPSEELEKLVAIVEYLIDHQAISKHDREGNDGEVVGLTQSQMLELVQKSPIRIAREQAGLTQKQLARVLRVSQPQVSKWERVGYRPRTTTLQKICGVLGVSIEKVL